MTGDPGAGSGDQADEVARLRRRWQRERDARLEAEAISERRTRELWEGQRAISLLADAATAANQAETLERGITDVLGQVGAFLGAEVGSAWLVDDDGLGALGIDWRGVSPRGRSGSELRVAFDEVPGPDSIEAHAIAQDATVFIPDVAEHPRGWPPRPTTTRGWALALPFGQRDGSRQARWRGVLGLYHPEPQAIDERHLFVARRAADELSNLLVRVEATTRMRRVNEELDARVEARTAELRRARQTAEAADRAKTSLMANLSHEIRTPLARVIGMLELIVPDHLPPAEAQYLQTAQDAATQLQQLFDSLLDLADLERGLVESAAQPTTPAALFDEAADRWRRDAAAAGLLLLADTADDRVVWVDPGLVLHATQALMDNAVKFGASGAVELTARTVPGSDHHPDQLQVRVTDHGPGIPPEQLDAIFEPFRQLDAGADRRHGGVGIGLTRLRRVIDQLHGTVTVHSEPGAGATFTFQVPSSPPVSRPQVDR